MRAGVGWEGEGATHSGMRRVPDTRAPFNPQIHESAPAAGCSCIFSWICICISSYICSVSICICVFICVCFVWFALFIQLCSLKSAPVSRLFRLRFAFLSHFLWLATSRRVVAAQLRYATVQWQLRDERRLCGIETNPSAALAAAAAALPAASAAAGVACCLCFFSRPLAGAHCSPPPPSSSSLPSPPPSPAVFVYFHWRRVKWIQRN